MKNRNWFWGIFFILAAVSIIAIQTGSFEQIGIQSLLIGAFLLAIIVHSLIKLNFFGVFFPMSFLYMVFWQPLGLPFINYWLVILASVLTSIGFGIIFGSHHKYHTKWQRKCEGGSQSDSESIDDNNPDVSVRFGSASKYLHADCLKSGNFNSSFGELELFFDKVQLSPEGAEIYVDCSFGSIVLNIPREWRVKDSVNVTLGAVNNEGRTANLAEGAPTLIIKGKVQFGAVEIKYI